MMNDSDIHYQLAIDSIELAADLVAAGEIQSAAELMQIAAGLLCNITNNTVFPATDHNLKVAK